jgi:hypothetical protein
LLPAMGRRFLGSHSVQIKVPVGDILYWFAFCFLRFRRPL